MKAFLKIPLLVDDVVQVAKISSPENKALPRLYGINPPPECKTVSFCLSCNQKRCHFSSHFSSSPQSSFPHIKQLPPVKK